jgi:Uri superfamily endonuclease
MQKILLDKNQKSVLQHAGKSKVFLRGPAGCGKTTVGLSWLEACLKSKIPADKILILVPQRTLATPYYQYIHSGNFNPGAFPTILTFGGLAQRMISLFWPLISKAAGFKNPSQPATFLTLETAQYEMAKIVLPLIQEGEFESVTIDRNRLYSQILDNLNKSALVGFPFTEFGTRLASSHLADPVQGQMYLSAQNAATQFRNHCLENNFLDFSLQIEVFVQHLWSSVIVKNYLIDQYIHMIYENIEEDPPITHDIIAQWLPSFQSALLIYDELGGYRSFLGADVESGLNLKELCDQEIELNHSFIMPPILEEFQQNMTGIIHGQKTGLLSSDINEHMIQHYSQFIPEMVKTIAGVVNDLIKVQKILPDQIAILSPFLSDALRFSLQNSLAAFGFSTQSHRPSRAIVDEPATRTFLTLAKIAHPNWNLIPTDNEVRYTLMQSLTDGDLIRADLLSKILYRRIHPEQRIGSFDQIIPQMQERITYHLGEKYERLRKWIVDYLEEPPLPLDAFISKLYGEVISQKSFGFHEDYESARIISRLIESIRKFGKICAPRTVSTDLDLGREYIQTIECGLLSALSLPYQENVDPNSILIMPAYSFLMLNHPVQVQFWLDIGSPGWSERINQPLTHPFILSRHWEKDRVWTDADEVATSQDTLVRLVGGLVHRCKDKIYLFSTQVNEQGMEESGKLIKSLQIFYKNNALQQVAHV